MIEALEKRIRELKRRVEARKRTESPALRSSLRVLKPIDTAIEDAMIEDQERWHGLVEALGESRKRLRRYLLEAGFR